LACALQSIAKRIGIILSGRGLVEKVVFTGNVAKNIGVKKALEKALEVNIIIPEEPQIVGALGAAIFANNQLIQSNRKTVA
jgi:(R)-2-hydroxyacyl-CoA dehydratese activating ATPase